MIKYDFSCKLDKKMKDTLTKNPHTIQYFCNTTNIKINKNSNTNYSYKFKRIFNPPLHTNDILNEHLTIKNYKKNELPITLSDIPYVTKYIHRKQLPATTVHWGQMKLFLSTLHFLLKCCPKNKKVNILYVGSAEGHNIPLLVNMFSNTYWYLVDPRDVFDKRLYKMDRVKQIKIGYFTDKLAQEMKIELHKNYFLFISDIRLFTNNNKKEEDIETDMKLQLGWHKILNPEYSQLKFRIPYYKDSFDYLDGDLYLQEYAPISSTETRLICKKNAKMTKYKLEEYEGKLFYFNRVMRSSYYKHRYNIDYVDHCYDCSKFMYLINEYNTYNHDYFKKKSIKKIIEEIIEDIKTKNTLKEEAIKISKQIFSK